MENWSGKKSAYEGSRRMRDSLWRLGEFKSCFTLDSWRVEEVFQDRLLPRRLDAGPREEAVTRKWHHPSAPIGDDDDRGLPTLSLLRWMTPNNWQSCAQLNPWHQLTFQQALPHYHLHQSQNTEETPALFSVLSKALCSVSFFFLGLWCSLVCSWSICFDCYLLSHPLWEIFRLLTNYKHCSVDILSFYPHAMSKSFPEAYTPFNSLFSTEFEHFIVLLLAIHISSSMINLFKLFIFYCFCSCLILDISYITWPLTID